MSANRCNVFVLRALAAAALLSAVAASPGRFVLPEGHVTCYRDDPKFDECFRTSLETLLRAFNSTGVPSLGVGVLDPFHVPLMPITYTQGDDVASNVTVTDIMGRGIGAMKINSIRSNFSTGDAFWMNMNTYMPRFDNEGHYAVEGHFLDNPIHGSGRYNLTSGGMKGTWKIRGRHFLKKGVDHIRIDHIDFRPSLRTMHFEADDLFTGNKQLSAAVIAAVNAFWPIFYELTLPGFSYAWGSVLTERANQVFLKVPFDTLFPLRAATARRP